MLLAAMNVLFMRLKSHKVFERGKKKKGNRNELYCDSIGYRQCFLQHPGVMHKCECTAFAEPTLARTGGKSIEEQISLKSGLPT